MRNLDFDVNAGGVDGDQRPQGRKPAPSTKPNPSTKPAPTEAPKDTGAEQRRFEAAREQQKEAARIKAEQDKQKQEAEAKEKNAIKAQNDSFEASDKILTGSFSRLTAEVPQSVEQKGGGFGGFVGGVARGAANGGLGGAIRGGAKEIKGDAKPSHILNKDTEVSIVTYAQGLFKKEAKEYRESLVKAFDVDLKNARSDDPKRVDTVEKYKQLAGYASKATTLLDSIVLISNRKEGATPGDEIELLAYVQNAMLAANSKESILSKTTDPRFNFDRTNLNLYANAVKEQMMNIANNSPRDTSFKTASDNFNSLLEKFSSNSLSGAETVAFLSTISENLQKLDLTKKEPEKKRKLF